MLVLKQALGKRILFSLWKQAIKILYPKFLGNLLSFVNLSVIFMDVVILVKTHIQNEQKNAINQVPVLSM